MKNTYNKLFINFPTNKHTNKYTNKHTNKYTKCQTHTETGMHIVTIAENVVIY